MINKLRNFMTYSLILIFISLSVMCTIFKPPSNVEVKLYDMSPPTEQELYIYSLYIYTLILTAIILMIIWITQTIINHKKQ